jgi:nucleotide-binding universal stress UspA family protein
MRGRRFAGPLAQSRSLPPATKAAKEATEGWVHTIPYGEPEDQQQDPIATEYGFVDPGRELVRFTGEVDLVLLGSRSEGRLARLLNGSVSDYLARRSHCPVIVLPRGAHSASRQDRLSESTAAHDR